MCRAAESAAERWAGGVAPVERVFPPSLAWLCLGGAYCRGHWRRSRRPGSRRRGELARGEGSCNGGKERELAELRGRHGNGNCGGTASVKGGGSGARFLRCPQGTRPAGSARIATARRIPKSRITTTSEFDRRRGALPAPPTGDQSCGLGTHQATKIPSNVITTPTTEATATKGGGGVCFLHRPQGTKPAGSAHTRPPKSRPGAPSCPSRPPSHSAKSFYRSCRASTAG